MKILYVVIAAQNVPPSIQKGDETAHVYSRQLKQGMNQLGIEADYFPVAGTFSRWNYLKAAFKLFWLSLRGDLNSYDLIHAHYGYNGVIARCQSQGVNPGYALGRDYEEHADGLLVAITEQRARADIDRLAEVLGAAVAAERTAQGVPA